MTTADRSIQQQLEEIRRRYLAHLAERVQEIVGIWYDLTKVAWTQDRLASLQLLASALVGSASSAGLPRVSALAADLEGLVGALVASAGERDESASAAVERCLTELIDVAHAPPEPPASGLHFAPSPAPQRIPRDTTVLVVGEDSAAGARLARQLDHAGFRAVAAEALASLPDAIARHAPSAMVLDIDPPLGSPEGPQRAVAMMLPETPIPIVYLSGRDDFEARLWAVRAGGRAFLTKPADVDALAMALHSLTGTFVPEPYRVVILDDSRVLGALFAAFLRDAGMLTLVLSEPSAVLQALQEFQPDLLLLDMYLPGCSGPEIAAMVRQHGAFVSLPIIFLSGESDRELQLSALDQGGDEFLTKPISGPQLISAVTSRARRARALRAQQTHDGLTGLLTHVSIKDQVLREVSRARRYGTALSAAVLDVDHLSQINDRHGHAAGDQVLTALARLLQRRLRRSDCVGRYGGEEFLILLPNTDGPAARRVMDEVRGRFASVAHTFGGEPAHVAISGGVASLAPEGDGREMLAAAEAALAEAKRAGRNRIVGAPPEGPAREGGHP